MTTDLLKAAAALMGRKGGKIGGVSRSEAKTAAVRLNGRLGGRKAAFILVYEMCGVWHTENPKGKATAHPNKREAVAYAKTRTAKVIIGRRNEP